MQALLLLALTQTLVEPAARQGYYLSGGVRSGVMAPHDSDIGGLGLLLGGAFTLRAGQMAGDSLGFGIVVSSAGGSNDDWTGGYGGLQLEGQLLAVSHLAVRAAIGVAGLGIGRVDESLAQKDDPEGTFGTLYTLGASYDWFPWWDPGDGSGGFAVTSFVEGTVLPGDGLFAGLVLAGVEISYWFGLPRNKLDLPPEEAFER